MSQVIYCCECGDDVQAELITGRTAYPHRPDLHSLPFWKCPTCNNFVGCHHKTKDRTKPMGVIANQPIKNARKRIHAKLDPIWKLKTAKRSHVYAYLSGRLGYTYHTGEIRSVAEVNQICEYLDEFKQLHRSRV